MLGCLTLYYERFEKHGYYSHFGTSKLIFFLVKRQLYHYLLDSGCAARASEEQPLLCCIAQDHVTSQ